MNKNIAPRLYHKYHSLLVVILVFFILISLLGCSKKEYSLLDKNNYSSSMKAYFNADSIQTVEQSYFTIKLVGLYSITKGGITNYFYDLIVAPKTNEKFNNLSITIFPDYKVHPVLSDYFTGKKFYWAMYDLKPTSAIFSELKKINYSYMFNEEFGSVRIQSFLCDGSKISLDNAKIDEDIVRKSIEQMIITVKTDFVSEEFHFSAIGLTKNLTLDEAKKINHSSIKGFLEGGISVNYSKYQGDK